MKHTCTPLYAFWPNVDFELIGMHLNLSYSNHVIKGLSAVQCISTCYGIHVIKLVNIIRVQVIFID